MSNSLDPDQAQQNDCKNYQHTTKFAANRQRVEDFTPLKCTGLQVRVHTGILFFLFLNQNICCGYSKEPSQ